MSLFKRVFDDYDPANSGNLALEECTQALARFLRAHGTVQDNHIERLAREVAIEDEDGLVSFEEFIQMSQVLCQMCVEPGRFCGAVFRDEGLRQFREAGASSMDTVQNIDCQLDRR